MLKTLPQKEFVSGMGEILKHALIADAKMFNLIKKESQRILNKDLEVLQALIAENLKIKASIVEKDIQEHGIRKKLNFGHTLAHAIEKHSIITHGEAVAIGIVFAAKVSCKKKYLSELDLIEIIKTIQQLGLPTETQIDKEKLKSAIIKDKKKNQKQISFVMLQGIGKAIVEVVEIEELKQWIDDLC
jgi:3-dehydroquinate synthase